MAQTLRAYRALWLPAVFLVLTRSFFFLLHRVRSCIWPFSAFSGCLYSSRRKADIPRTCLASLGWFWAVSTRICTGAFSACIFNACCYVRACISYTSTGSCAPSRAGYASSCLPSRTTTATSSAGTHREHIRCGCSNCTFATTLGTWRNLH